MTGGVNLTDVVKTLWEEGFFSEMKTIGNVMLELQQKGYHFEFDPVYSIMKNCEFVSMVLKEIEDTGIEMPTYVQRYPPPAAVGVSEIIYAKGYAYDFYKDIKGILQRASTKVAICDSYVGEELVTLYFDSLSDNIDIRILTSDQKNREKEKFLEIAKKYAEQPGKKLEVRVSSDCHDRMIFVDDSGWVCGSALKDVGKKPTYLIRIRNVNALRSIFDSMWAQAVKLV